MGLLAETLKVSNLIKANVLHKQSLDRAGVIQGLENIRAYMEYLGGVLELSIKEIKKVDIAELIELESMSNKVGFKGKWLS